MILNKPVSRRTGEPGNNLYELDATNNTHSYNNTNGSYTCMCQTNTGRLLWVRENNVVYKSDDDGITWSPLSYTTGTCSGIMNTRSGKIYARTDSSIYYSTDDGATWTNLNLDPGGNSYTVYFLKQAYGKYWYFFMKRVGSGSGSSRYYSLYYSEDGDSWTYLVSRTGSSCPFCLTPSGKFIVGGVSSNDNMLIYQSLAQVSTDNPTNIGPNDGVPSSRNTANYLILDAPSTPLGYTIWKGDWYSNDDGATWSSNSYFCTYHNGPILDNTDNTDSTSYPKEIYCKTSTGRIFGRLNVGSTLLYSDDNGVNWYEASTLNNTPLTSFMCITSDDVVYANYMEYNADMGDTIYIVCKTTPVYTTDYVAMYDSIPVTGKEVKEYVRQFKAYVQSLKT